MTPITITTVPVNAFPDVTAPPMVSEPVEDVAQAADESWLDNGPGISRQSHQVRKVHLIDLNSCNCGTTIMDTKIQEGQTVTMCQMAGCEMVWVNSLTILIAAKL